MADSKKTDKGTWKGGDLVVDKIVFNGKVVDPRKIKKDDGKEKKSKK